jgi:hypothetical protein
MNEAADNDHGAGHAEGRKNAAARLKMYERYFRDEIPDPFADPKIRARVAQTIARAAMKGNTGRY